MHFKICYLLSSPFALKEESTQAGKDSTSLCKTYDLGYQREDVKDSTFHSNCEACMIISVKKRKRKGLHFNKWKSR